MQCELCGKECNCRPAIVDGVKMMLCSDCMRHGEVIDVVAKPITSTKPILQRIKRPKEKDVYKGMSKELVPNWNKLIKSAREKKGFSREELGFKIGERTVTISKIENGDLRPSDKVAEKLEKELGINLFEEVSGTPSGFGVSHNRDGLTLGDFIKREDK
ncbi:MAG: TIGR00270 family protein [Thermoplasmata archaeon M9B1D]|nr:MAG: TIGR00270 family protein [Thermoplasmata archaeon M9B1D]